ncbi:MAG: peptidoglycan bridge formation glycyltransferase FemA/FemB family protein [Anaerolineae bacterium]|nr:peptidoglycan bridge formation glycyltransferase FemA/FemB family protein [Anaerolineae bacterium]
MSYRIIADSTTWNKALLALPWPHALQTWEWGEVKRKHGWTPVRLLWERDSRPIAATQVLRRPLPYTPWGVMYAPKGPALDYDSAETLDLVLDDLERFSRQKRGILLKIDPDTDSEDLVSRLNRRGWRYSAQQIQFRNTALLDLAPSEIDLLAQMKSKTRYNVRLAQRRGIEVRQGIVSDIALFYEMYVETGQRDGFLIRSLEYYDDAWRMFMDNGLAHMLLAEVESEIVAGLILFCFGATAWYMYGASRDVHRNLMPTYLLQWEAMRWAKAQGCAQYDLWGAPDVLDPGDSLWGVWRFKEGLGAQFTPHIGAYDYAPSRLLYWAYAVAVPRYIGLLRRRHSAQSSLM